MTMTVALKGNGDMSRVNGRPATLVDWVAAPDLVTIDIAAFLTGLDPVVIREIIGDGGVDTVEADGNILIDRQSLREFWELYWDLNQYAPALE